jgi:hypothetical protein
MLKPTPCVRARAAAGMSCRCDAGAFSTMNAAGFHRFIAGVLFAAGNSLGPGR